MPSSLQTRVTTPSSPIVTSRKDVKSLLESMSIHFEADAARAAHFKSSPWCAALIEDPAYTQVYIARSKPRALAEDTLMKETLATDKTIRAYLTLLRRPPPSQSPEEIVVLVDLGSGVNGFANVCHGGFVAALLDEVTGILLDIRKNVEGRTVPSMTAFLNVRFRRPVPTPGVIKVRAWVVKGLGRKMWIDGSVEDGQGNVCTTAEALYVELKSEL